MADLLTQPIEEGVGGYTLQDQLNWGDQLDDELSNVPAPLPARQGERVARDMRDE